MVYFGGQRKGSTQGQYHSAIEGLQDIYLKKIKPVEDFFGYEKFGTPPMTRSEIAGQPMILLIGQYSTGKTSFIQHLLGRNYPGAHIGPEPTTDRFVAVAYGEEERVIPGNAATSQPERPFSGLSQFGSNFLSKFQVSESPAALLESVTFIDTPGVLSGHKQRLGRSYDFVEVCEWFAERSDMILLLFDAHKLDISDELKDVISIVKPHQDKIRIVLNKADQISNQQLMRVYGALMWSLGKVILTPEVVRVYIGSFWSPVDPVNSENKALLEAEQSDLINDLQNLPKNSTIRKINEMIKRAKQVRVHAYLISHLRDQMPSMFGKVSKQTKMIANLNLEFTKVQHARRIPPSDFPDYENFQKILGTLDISALPRLSQRLMDGLEEALSLLLPDLLQTFSTSFPVFTPVPVNPFSGKVLAGAEKSLQTLCQVDRDNYLKIFHTSNPEAGKLSGAKAKHIFGASGLNEEAMAAIWNQADQDKDGCLTEKEFVHAMCLIDNLMTQNLADS